MAQELSKDDDYNSLGRIFHLYAQFESDHDNLAKALEFCQQSLVTGKLFSAIFWQEIANNKTQKTNNNQIQNINDQKIAYL